MKIIIYIFFRAVVNYVRALPSIEDHDTIANDVFGSQKDPRVKKMKDSVKYFHKGGFWIEIELLLTYNLYEIDPIGLNLSIWLYTCS